MCRFVSVALLSWLFLCNPAMADPAISNVTGRVSGGSSISISGSGFGASGPNIVLFEDFEKGTSGNQISLAANGATLGTWYGYKNVPGTYSNAYALSGSLSMLANGDLMDDSSLDNAGIIFEDAGGFDEFYIAFNFYTPSGDSPSGNNMKIIWACDSSACSSEPNTDLLLLNSNSSWGTVGDYILAGNTGSIYPGSSGAAWFAESTSVIIGGEWARFGFWEKTAHTANAGDNVYEVYGMSRTSDAWEQKYYEAPLIANHTTGTFHRLHIIGYGRSCPTAHCRWYFDDIYIATGPNSRARVEIGNNATYTSCTNMTILTPTAWGDTSITSTVRLGNFTTGTAYVFVTNADGTRNSTGYEITVNSAIGTISNITIGHGVTFR